MYVYIYIYNIYTHIIVIEIVILIVIVIVIVIVIGWQRLVEVSHFDFPSRKSRHTDARHPFTQ